MTTWSGTTTGSQTIQFTVVPQPCPCGCRNPANVVIPRAELERLAAAHDTGDVGVPVEFLRDVQRLAHPDLHTDARKDRATRVAALCSRLLRERPR